MWKRYGAAALIVAFVVAATRSAIAAEGVPDEIPIAPPVRVGPEPVRDTEVLNAMKRAADFLLRSKNAQGNWESAHKSFLAGETSLVLYALLTAGHCAQDDTELYDRLHFRSKELAPVVKWVCAQETDRTYAVGMQVAALLDNASWHKVKSLPREHIELKYMPAYSPDFNPIEHLSSRWPTRDTRGNCTSIPPTRCPSRRRGRSAVAVECILRCPESACTPPAFCGHPVPEPATETPRAMHPASAKVVEDEPTVDRPAMNTGMRVNNQERP